MLKTAGHVKKYYKQCCSIYDVLKNQTNPLYDVLEKQTNTFEFFLSEVNRFSNQISDSEEQNVFRGDMLEILAEIFFGAFASDPAVGLKDYVPVPLDKDYGVDGIGVNAAGTKCAVQVKYRKNPLDKITYSEVARTFTSGIMQLKLPLFEGQDNIFIFTSAYDVTVACKTVFENKIHVLNRDVIKNKIDNNVNFWNYAYEQIKDTLLPH